jgi:hypothetical protein
MTIPSEGCECDRQVIAQELDRRALLLIVGRIAGRIARRTATAAEPVGSAQQSEAALPQRSHDPRRSYAECSS